MKKILMGLLAISAATFSAIDLTSPGNEKNAFNPGETGKIAIKMKVKSKITPVKYVIFANSSDVYAGSSDSWTIPDIMLSQVKDDNAIGGQAPNVYVRKVRGDQSTTEALTNENVIFTVNFDTNYTGITARQVTLNAKNVLVAPTALMSQGELSAIVGAGGFTVTDKGEITKGGLIYRTPNNVKFFSDTRGVLKVTMATNPDASTTPMVDDIATVDGYFKNKQPFSALTISALVN